MSTTPTESLSSTLTVGVHGLIEQARRNGDLVSLVNTLHPPDIVRSINTGVAAVAQRCGMPVAAVEELLPSELEQVLLDLAAAREELVGLWNQHEGTLARTVAGFAGGFLDGYSEAVLGVDLGLGEALARFGADKVRDARVKPALDLFAQRLATFEEWVRYAGAVLDASEELSAAARRQEVRNQRLGCFILLVLTVVVVAACYGAWRLYLHFRDSGSSAQTAATVPSASSAPTPSLVGHWRTAGGQRLFATSRAGGVVFDTEEGSEDWLAAGYLGGEQRFKLTATDSAGAYLVEDKVRPVLPSKMKWSGAAHDSCNTFVTAVGAQPLHASVDGEQLTVQLVRLELPPPAFISKRGVIQSCSMGSGKEARYELRLQRMKEADP